MGATVLVLDTNQVRDFPLLQSRDWEELISKAPDWGLKFILPEVCFHEAVSVVRRKWSQTHGTVSNIKVSELGLDEAKQEMLQRIEASIEGYEDALTARLSEIGVEVVPIPESVEMLDVARRAIDRRKPYSEGKKDAFRDTLIWYTAQSVAARDKDCDVWFISTNHNDFGGASDDQEACPYPLHPQLVEDLESADIPGRVSYVKTVGRLKQHLAATYDALPEKDRDSLIDALLKDDFESRLFDALMGEILDKSSAALPVKTVQAILDGFVSTPETLEFVDAAMRGGGVWTAQFHLNIDASVALLLDEGDTSSINKALMVAGRIEAGMDGGVRDLIVTSVEALPGDPMRRAYTFPSAEYASWLKSMDTGRPDYAELLKNFQPRFDYGEVFKRPLLDYDEAFKNFQPRLDFGEVFKRPLLDHDELLKNLRLPDVSELLKNVRPLTDVGEIFKNIRPDLTLKNILPGGPETSDADTGDNPEDESGDDDADPAEGNPPPPQQ